VKQRKIRVSFEKNGAWLCLPVRRFDLGSHSIWAAGSWSEGCGNSHARERRRAAELRRASSISSQGLRFQARITENDAGDKRDRSRPSGRTHEQCRRCAADGTAAPTSASSRRRFNTRGRKQTAPLTCSPPCEAPRRILDDCEAAVAWIDGGGTTLGFGG
jgi:hypothetical protein